MQRHVCAEDDRGETLVIEEVRIEPPHITTLRETLRLDRCPVRPFAHQVEGIQALIDHPFFLLADEMGAGKTLQTIVAAQILFERGEIDRVVVIAPASVRAVWYDPELGELAKHLFLPSRVTEFHAKLRQWDTEAKDPKRLEWYISNFDFIRSSARLIQMRPLTTQRTLLVLDEASATKNHKAKQTIACLQLRKQCGRVWLLNGTPIANHLGDMFSQGQIMSSRILECPSYTQYCARYAVMQPVMGPGGKPVKSARGFVIQTPVSWKNVEDVQRRFAPYTLRRLKKDCLADLPPKLPPVTLTSVLTPELWRIYTEMRDELVVWLNNSTLSMAPQVMTKIMRLAQITSGFLGGVEELRLNDGFEVDADVDGPMVETNVKEIGREKLDTFIDWFNERLYENPNFKVLVFSCCRPEMLRLYKEQLSDRPYTKAMMIGGQKKEERAAARRLLDPRTAPEGAAVLICSETVARFGHSFTAAADVFRMSSSYSLLNRVQGDDRVHRPGQTRPVSYFHLQAVGPKGQKTIDHIIYSNVDKKDDFAMMTTGAWVTRLMEE